MTPTRKDVINQSTISHRFVLWSGLIVIVSPLAENELQQQNIIKYPYCCSTFHHLLDKYLAVSLVHCFSLSLLLLLFPPSCPPSSPSPSAGRNSSGCWWSFNKQHIFRTFYFNRYIALKSPHKLSPKIFMTKNDTLLFAPSKWLGIPTSETIKLESSWGCHLGWVLPL